MKSLKRIASITLSAVVAISMFAGCGNNQATKNDKTATTSKDSTQNQAVTWEKAPKVVVTAENRFEVALGKTGSDINDNPYVRHIFEKTGVRLHTLLLPTKVEDYKQKLAIELAGGNQIDLISFWGLQQDWIDTGTIVAINSILEKEKNSIPNILNNVTEDGWKAVTKLNEKTKQADKWAFPVRNEQGRPFARACFVRQDWLDKLKMEKPKTIEDFSKMLKAFTENDPDGNGVKDTYGVGVGKGVGSFNIWFHIFGIDTWREEILPGNKLVPYGHTDRYRNGLKVVRSWMSNGWVDVEGFADQTISEKKIRNGKIGVVQDSIQKMAEHVEVMNKNGIKDAKWTVLDYTPVNNFDNKTYGWSMKPGNSYKVTMLAAASKSANQQNILKVLNWMYSEEGTQFLDYGLEGKEHKIVDGKKKKDPVYTYQDQKSYLETYWLGNSYKHVNEPDFFVNNYDASKYLVKEYLTALTTKYDKLVWEPGDVKFQYSKLDGFKQYPDYRKVIGDWQGEFLIGKRDPANDADWKAYLTESEKYGFQKILDEAANLYFTK